MKVQSRSRKAQVAVLAACGTLLTTGVAAVTTDAAVAAPGNNGVVKIDGIPFDSYPDNEPHVGCTFQVDFYNYEQGNLNASVRFTAQPPTGKSVLLVADNIFIGEDAAGGGTDVDAQETYDLSTALKLYMAHPNQGYHVKLKVNAPSSIGKDTKYKTFWVTGCAGY